MGNPGNPERREAAQSGRPSAGDPEVLIEPRRIPGDPKIDHPVIVALFEPYVDLVRRELQAKKKDVGRMRFPSMNYLSARWEGKRISLVGAPLGAPAAVILLERLIAMGGRKFMVLGCCGSLQKDLKIGDWVLPTSALIDEGTSGQYDGGGPEGWVRIAEGRVLEKLRRALQQEKQTFREGGIWTTDGLFRETREKVARYSAKGLWAVEMEVSALFTVAAFRGVDLAVLLVVSDELAGLKWKSGFRSPRFWLSSKQAARLAIRVAAGL